MIVRIISFIFSFLLLLNCSYEPIYSKKKIEKNYNFSIKEITFLNQNTINQPIKENLLNYFNQDGRLKKISLEINTNTNKTVTLRNKQGNIEIFSIEITVDVKVHENETLINYKKFKENFKYKNQSDKFSLEKYEKVIENNLITKISNNIIIYLFSIE